MTSSNIVFIIVVVADSLSLHLVMEEIVIFNHCLTIIVWLDCAFVGIFLMMYLDWLLLYTYTKQELLA